MRRTRRWLLAAPTLAIVLLTGCRELPEAPEKEEPYTLETIEGTDLSRVILTADGAQRIGLETAPVSDVRGESTVPESAIWIDFSGEDWLYTNPEPLVFVREVVVVDRYQDGVAVLAEGPETGTDVVTVGVAELIGSEFGV